MAQLLLEEQVVLLQAIDLCSDRVNCLEQGSLIRGSRGRAFGFDRVDRPTEVAEVSLKRISSLLAEGLDRFPPTPRAKAARI
jgi:hypothetical protein